MAIGFLTRMSARSLTRKNAARMSGSSLGCRNTLPGPGRSWATSALSSPLVTPPWTTITPELAARSQFRIEMPWIEIASHRGEQLDVTVLDPACSLGGIPDLHVRPPAGRPVAQHL